MQFSLVFYYILLGQNTILPTLLLKPLNLLFP